jgi:hypothetical protein
MRGKETIRPETTSHQPDSCAAEKPSLRRIDRAPQRYEYRIAPTLPTLLGLRLEHAWRCS